MSDLLCLIAQDCCSAPPMCKIALFVWNETHCILASDRHQERIRMGAKVRACDSTVVQPKLLNCTKIEHPTTCLATMPYAYAQLRIVSVPDPKNQPQHGLLSVWKRYTHRMWSVDETKLGSICVTIFGTHGKFRPVSNCSYTLLLELPILMRSWDSYRVFQYEQSNRTPRCSRG